MATFQIVNLHELHVVNRRIHGNVKFENKRAIVALNRSPEKYVKQNYSSYFIDVGKKNDKGKLNVGNVEESGIRFE